MEFKVELRASDPAWVRPSEPLVEGARYRLEVDATCRPEVVEFSVGAPAELPTDLGEASLGELHTTELTVGTGRGSCTTQAEVALVRAELRHSARARPWAELLVVRAMVDEKRYVPTLDYRFPFRLPEPKATLYALCTEDHDASPALELGSHELVFEAELPGGDASLQTASASFALQCEHDDGCAIASAQGGARDGVHGALGPSGVVALILLRRRRNAVRGTSAWSR